jgi:hypothetical protein
VPRQAAHLQCYPHSVIMPVRFDTIWERFLAPVLRHLTGHRRAEALL